MESFERLKVGDEVGVPNLEGTEVKIDKVTAVTKHVITVSNHDYARKSGRRISTGISYGRIHLQLLGKEAEADLKEVAEKPNRKEAKMSDTIGTTPDVPFGADLRFLTMPVVCLPEGTLRVRRKIRNGEFMRIYVRTSSGITCYIPKFSTGRTALVLDEDLVQGANAR